MSKPFLVAFGAAVVVIVVLIWTGFATTKGNHLVPRGSIGKVRTVKVEDNTTLMILDFNVANDSDRDMVVRTIEPSLIESDGSSVSGSPVSTDQAEKAFRAYKILGEQYNQVMKERDVIPPRQSVDRMIAVLFDLPYDVVESRKRVDLRIEDVTGPVLTLSK